MNKLDEIIKDFEESLIHIEYLLSNNELSFIDSSTLLSLKKQLSENIQKLKRL